MPEAVVTLYHAPNTRSSSVLHLLEELGTPYELRILNQKKNEHLAPGFLKINPLGKVPTLVDGGAVITETVAIMVYLADAFPQADLAPEIGDPMRGPYLRWMTLYAAAWEPAIVDRAQKRGAGMRAMSTYGDFDALFNAVVDQIEAGPFFLGSKFTTLDVLWGGALTWMTMFKLLPEHPIVAAYLGRLQPRPALARMRAKDQQLAATMSA